MTDTGEDKNHNVSSESSTPDKFFLWKSSTQIPEFSMTMDNL